MSGVTFPPDDVWLNQRSIACAYALGLTAVVPWDVFVVNEPRFFGDPADFAPFLEMVRSNQSLFDDYVSDQDFFGSYGPVLPGEGTVLNVDRSYPGRTSVTWSRGRSFAMSARADRSSSAASDTKPSCQSTVGTFYLPPDMRRVGRRSALSERAARILI